MSDSPPAMTRSAQRVELRRLKNQIAFAESSIERDQQRLAKLRTRARELEADLSARAPLN